MKEYLTKRNHLTKEILVSAWKGLNVGDKYCFEDQHYIVTGMEPMLDGFCWIRKTHLNLIEKIEIVVERLKYQWTNRKQLLKSSWLGKH